MTRAQRRGSAPFLTGSLCGLRLIMLLQCMAACCVCNFLVLFYHNAKGLTYQQVGIVVGGVYPIMNLIGQPIGCSVADYTGQPKLVRGSGFTRKPRT